MNHGENNIPKKRKPVKPVTSVQLAADLGKLPPQAVDLEEAVLGALMLEKGALLVVREILTKPEQFYKEAHQKIYEAITVLSDADHPIDILTVTQQLKKTGSLEIVGGPYYISQLTNRVASAANIEFHSRIVLQKFIQRELIRVSTDTVRDAYEDTNDVLEQLDKLREAAEGISRIVLTRSTEVTDTMKEEPDSLIMTFMGRKVLTVGNVNGLVANPGSGKSNVCESIAASAINEANGLPDIDALGFQGHLFGGDLLFVDTERSVNDSLTGYRRMMRRLNVKMYGDKLMKDGKLRHMRYELFKEIAKPKDKRRRLESLIIGGDFKLLMLDGIGDMVTSVNDEIECVELIAWLGAVASKLGMGIFVTIHDNPAVGKQKPRGVLGSELYRKAEALILLQRTKSEEDPEERAITTNFEFGKVRNDSNSNEIRFSWNDEHSMFLTTGYESGIVMPPKPDYNGKKVRTATVDDTDMLVKKVFEKNQGRHLEWSMLANGLMKLGLKSGTVERRIRLAAKLGIIDKDVETDKYYLVDHDSNDLPF